MISESTIFRMALTCDAIPPAGLHCEISRYFPVELGEGGSVFMARIEVDKSALAFGWRMDGSMPRKYPQGRHLCPACATRWPKVKWRKR